MTDHDLKQALRTFSGLSSEEAIHRRRQAGFNELPVMKRRSVLRIVAEVIREPMFALLVVGGVVYLLLGDRVAADARVANFLALLCERYGRMGYSSKRFVLRMTRQEIANHLGLTMETVSRDFTTDCSRSNGGLMRLSEQTRPVLSWI